jgi:hypothetical protein
LRQIDQADRSRLGRAGIKLGRKVVYATALLRPEACSCVQPCVGPFLGPAFQPSFRRRRPAISCPADDVDDDTCLAMGFPVVAGVAIRADEIESIAPTWPAAPAQTPSRAASAATLTWPPPFSKRSPNPAAPRLTSFSVLSDASVSLHSMYTAMQDESYDVVIVGAGPGGLSCARALAGSGQRVLVLEKSESLGKKICAGELTAKVLPGEDFDRGRPWTEIHVGNDHTCHALKLPRPFAWTAGATASRAT